MGYSGADACETGTKKCFSNSSSTWTAPATRLLRTRRATRARHNRCHRCSKVNPRAQERWRCPGDGGGGKSIPSAFQIGETRAQDSQEHSFKTRTSEAPSRLDSDFRVLKVTVEVIVCRRGSYRAHIPSVPLPQAGSYYSTRITSRIGAPAELGLRIEAQAIPADGGGAKGIPSGSATGMAGRQRRAAPFRESRPKCRAASGGRVGSGGNLSGSLSSRAEFTIIERNDSFSEGCEGVTEAPPATSRDRGHRSRRASTKAWVFPRDSA